MITQQTKNQSRVKFTRATQSRLKYWINTSGIEIDFPKVTRQEDGHLLPVSVYIKSINSRNVITPGHIAIPIEDINDVIGELTRLRNLINT
jgi:hypothetical protein